MVLTQQRGKLPPPPPGCDEWRTEQGYLITQIHYSADPGKDAQWVTATKAKCPSEYIWQQEYEIDAYARSGAMMYPEFSYRVNVYEPFPIPHEWTRYMCCDPHKRRPHAFLWLAVDPWEDHWYYREYWPSKVYGKRGHVPEDDELWNIHQYAETLRQLEGPDIDVFGPGGFADNQSKQEVIYRRIMDTHGKAIFVETHDGKDEPETFWDRYADEGFRFFDAKKDVDAGRDTAARRLLPRDISDEHGKRKEPVVHIFTTLPELIWELRHNRFPILKPQQVERQDPTPKELLKRKHMTDNFRYLEMADPVYINPANYTAENLRDMSLPPRGGRKR